MLRPTFSSSLEVSHGEMSTFEALFFFDSLSLAPLFSLLLLLLLNPILASLETTMFFTTGFVFAEKNRGRGFVRISFLRIIFTVSKN